MTPIFPKRTFAILILLLVFITGYSQTIQKKVYQTAFTKKAPQIDGLMNDSCWNQVEWGDEFIQTQPYENKPPSQKTAFKIL